MKIFKGKYSWQTTAHSSDADGKEIKCYIDVQFKKGYEPTKEEVKGELIFKDENGMERGCFLSSYKKKDGTVCPKLVVMGLDTQPKEQNVQMPLTGTNRDVTGHIDVRIDPDELPFY